MEYERGLQRLRALVKWQAPELRHEFELFEVRLRECLEEERFGESRDNTANKNRVIYQLMRFTDEHFALRFIDLCRPDDRSSILPDIDKGTVVGTEVSSTAYEKWEGGNEIVLRGARYIIHQPVIATWAEDHSALYQRARAQQVEEGRMVWLKQVQLRQASGISASWKGALEKEMRLLDRLEEQQQHFPRSLAFEQDIHTFTFAHGVIEGRSWGQMFGAAGKPLDRVLIRMLLRSALALCETLRALHRNRCAHRALSPDDILYLDNRRTLLRDVGLATWRYKPGEGADGYRAPEQDIANGGLSLPGSHTDVYQLGMVLYHFITGHLPASTKQIVEPSAWNKELMPEIDAVLLRALALRIKERPTIADFSAALRRALR